jgi:hypothetical protein
MDEWELCGIEVVGVRHVILILLKSMCDVRA